MGGVVRREGLRGDGLEGGLAGMSWLSCRRCVRLTIFPTSSLP